MPNKRGPPTKKPAKEKTKALLRGHRIRVPPHPTEFDSQPWFPLVLRINNITTQVDYNTMYSSWVSQLGLNPQSGFINVRFQMVKVWGPLPVSTARLTVRFHDIFSTVVGSTPFGSRTILEEVSDYADQVNRACVGFRYSTIQQATSVILSTANTDPIITMSGAGPGTIAYVYLLWRPASAVPAPNEGYEMVEPPPYPTAPSASCMKFFK